MKTKLFALLAGVAMLGFVGAANAQTPVQLSNSQLDNVTAGATAISLSGGIAGGTLAAGSVNFTFAAVAGANAIAKGSNTSIGVSWAPGPGAFAGAGTWVAVTSP